MPSMLELIAERNAAQQRRVVQGKTGESIDVPEGSGLLITGCSGCTVNAPGRNVNVTLERCDGTSLQAGYVMGSLEVILCNDVTVSAKRCRTITVDMSKDVTVSCECQPSSDGSGAHEEGGGGGTVLPHPRIKNPRLSDDEAADEASAVRLFTSSSERVSIAFEGLPGGDVTYNVPRDRRLEKGDVPRSVSRITVDRNDGSCMGEEGGGGVCKTLRCDKYGIPLAETEAAKAGRSWTWENGRGV